MNQELDAHNNILDDLDTNVDITKGAVKRSTDKTNMLETICGGMRRLKVLFYLVVAVVIVGLKEYEYE